MPDLDEFRELGEQANEADELRAALRTLELRLKRAKAKTADLVDAVRQGAKDAALVQGKPPAVPRPARDRRTRRAEAAVLLLSDWHFGKQTDSFDSDVAAKRIRVLGEKVAQITAIERSDHPVREVHALLNGDLAENVGIFAGQAFEVDSSMFAQVFAAAGALETLLRHLLATFPTVVAWEQSGNHGRLGRKGDHPREDNIDILIYRLARERLGEYERSGRLVWNERRSWYTLVEVGNYTALMVHGDQIKSFGGNVPAYGIARKANAWATGVLGVKFNDVLLGHFHQPLVVPLANGQGRAFVNPSIESDSAYAQEMMAATGTPGQRLHYVNPERGRITSERVVWLDEAGA